MRQGIERRIKVLEAKIPKKQTIYIQCWLKDEVRGVTFASCGGKEWLRTDSESVSEFRDRVNSELGDDGPYPRLVILS